MKNKPQINFWWSSIPDKLSKMQNKMNIKRNETIEEERDRLHQEEVLNTTKKEMTLMWKIFYSLWVFKIKTYKHCCNADPQFRLIHPLWLLTFIVLFLIWIATEWILNRQMYRELKDNFIFI